MWMIQIGARGLFRSRQRLKHKAVGPQPYLEALYINDK
jgi:hypothetical protein